MADFNLAIPRVLQNEGGYVFDEKDPGGETNFGISKRAYPNLDIKNLTKDQAIEIYRKDFWKFDGIIDQKFANKLFDAYVNMKRNAIKILQNLLNLPIDGAYGPNTEKAINAANPDKLLESYKYELCLYYQKLVQKDPSLGKFIVGWLRRANEV